MSLTRWEPTISVGMPIASLTALGSATGELGAAVAAIVDYLEGRQTAMPSRSATALDADGLVGYYADTKTTDALGWWGGRGVNGTQLTGPVDPSTLASILLGRHPHTAEQLVSTSGSAGRARSADQTTKAGLPSPQPSSSATLSVAQAADVLGVSHQRVRELAAAGVDRARKLADGSEVDPRVQYLSGSLDGRRWSFDPAEVERARQQRVPPRVVVAYDFTISVEKSISLAWVQADDDQRTVIEEALRTGVQAGVSHLEDHGLAVRRDRGAEAADGMWAASYLHLTNRNLEPQLHVHTVIANVAANATTGETKAIDARGLFREVTAAGYVAGAEIRAQLSERLGVEWDRPHKGTMEMAGVPDGAIKALSTRRSEVMALADELGFDTPKARQVAALATRAPKHHHDEFDDLVTSWRSLMAEHGFGASEAAAVLGAEGFRRVVGHPEAPTAIAGLSQRGTAELFAWLGSPAGLTRSSGVFGRSDIVQAVVMWDAEFGGGRRLHADSIQEVADRVLAGAAIGPRFDDRVVSLRVGASLQARSAGRQWFTTESTLALEAAVIDAYSSGRSAVDGVAAAVAAASIERWEVSSGHRLGADQAAMIGRVTSGSDRFALVVGPAGTGKTAALEVACRAWEDAGLRPIGVAVTGSATDTLAASTGIETMTVASLLARDVSGVPTGLGANSVVVVDEASLLSNRDHFRLVELVSEAGARMVAIGDPAQHGAVEAGGLWAHLVESAVVAVSTLEVNRRQSAAHMADVRLANDEIRNGEIGAAFKRLAAGERVVTAPTSGELFDRLAADWYVDLLARRGVESSRPSSMMAENHSVRRELITRAQALLVADATLSGEPVVIGEGRFHVGDRVITRTQHESLRFEDGSKLRNGTFGTVTDVHRASNGRHELTVHFDAKGPQRLDHDFLTVEVRSGLRGGLVPAYAVTTHVAQGQTMTAGRTVGSDASSRAAVYVGLSRGTDDARLYVVDRSALHSTEVPDVGLPVVKDSRTTTERMVASLARTPVSEVATAVDPAARSVSRAASASLLDLRNAPIEEVSLAAQRVAVERAARRAVIDPEPVLVDRIGARPPATDPSRPQWDRAVLATVRYWATHEPDCALAQLIERHGSARRVAPEEWLAAQVQLERAERNHLEKHSTSLLAQLLETGERPIAASVLEARASKAATSPASYVTDLIGPQPPVDASNAASYQRTVEAIERWRHQRGLDPTDRWPDATTAREVAIGQCPEDVRLARGWRRAQVAIDRAVGERLASQQNPSALAPAPTEPGRRLR